MTKNEIQRIEEIAKQLIEKKERARNLTLTEKDVINAIVYGLTYAYGQDLHNIDFSHVEKIIKYYINK